jgi:tRNA A-37 threonylcarbamoyl transferase component Bud32
MPCDSSAQIRGKTRQPFQRTRPGECCAIGTGRVSRRLLLGKCGAIGAARMCPAYWDSMTDTHDRLAAALTGRYAIERVLGRGGMATVYLAEDLRHHRKVAIKVLPPEIGLTLGAGRFLREIEVAARLQHPNIVPLLDSGEFDDLCFFVMPYVEGKSLRDRLVHGSAFTSSEAVVILREVADALSYAHAHGVVHRDIKPGNILLSGRHAMVLDFGVAKAVTEATGRGRTIRRHGWIRGVRHGRQRARVGLQRSRRTPAVHTGRRLGGRGIWFQ